MPDLDHRERNARLDGPVHGWFSLSYANYAVLHRTRLQSMPVEWQERFVACLEELRSAYWGSLDEPRYTVYCRDDGGRFVRDPVPHYDRGRTFLPPAKEAQDA